MVKSCHYSDIFTSLTAMGLTWCYITVAFGFEMYQVDPGPRSINSSVIVISELEDLRNEDVFIVSLHAAYSSESQVTTTSNKVGHVVFERDANCPSIETGQRSIPNLNFRFECGATLQVIWNFSSLQTRDDKLNLTTIIPQREKQEHLLLHVEACKASETVAIFGQNSSLNVTAEGNGHFGDTATCLCNNINQILFNISTLTPADHFTKCSSFAKWTGGCTEGKCWGAPLEVTVSQINHSVAASSPFYCHYVENYPKATDLRFKINGFDIPENYKLVSSDHGKNISCEVISKYTLATAKKAESVAADITVYFPPEQASLSDNSITMELDESADLNFSYVSNPRNGPTTVKIMKLGSGNVAANMFSDIWKEVDIIRHKHVIKVTMNSADGYGAYNICGYSADPAGGICSTLVISNASTASKFADSQETFPNSIVQSGITTPQVAPIGIVVGAAVGGVVALTGIALLIWCCLKKPEHPEEPIYAIPNKNKLGIMKKNVIYGASPVDPESQEIYALVERRSGSSSSSPGEDNRPPTPDEDNISRNENEGFAYAIVNIHEREGSRRPSMEDQGDQNNAPSAEDDVYAILRE